MIDRLQFGSTGHESSRIIFGAAAVAAGSQERADRLVDTLLGYGVNHIDTAARYGDSELLLAGPLSRHRERFFLASKTGERTYDGAWRGIRASLERLAVDRLDLIQLHNLVDEEEWRTAMGPGGALQAAVEARAQGLVRFVGVTGHGTQVARRHIESLERYEFDSVLLPYNYLMMSQPRYADDFEELSGICRERGVAVQTIKSVARRRWQETPEKRYSWYEPLTAEADVEAAVRWVLDRPGIFLNTSSDSRLLEIALRAASRDAEVPDEAAMAALAERQSMEPLFVPGQDGV